MTTHTKEVVESAQNHIAVGRQVHFKWTCTHCGTRQTFTESNVCYRQGLCEECHSVTDVLGDDRADLNYILIGGMDVLRDALFRR